MSHQRNLLVVRAVHTAIYVVMATASFVALFAGITGAQGPWLWIALVLVGVESAVFVGNGFRCPFTALATRYAAKADPTSDTFFPERLTRHTFAFFGPLIVLALVLLAARGLGLLT